MKTLVTVWACVCLYALTALPAVADVPPAGYLADFHAAPTWFERDGYGGFVGETVAGERFAQRPVVTDSTVRLHRFDIGAYHFYISDKGAFVAESDLAAVSRYLTIS